MKRTLCCVAALLAVGTASAEIRIIQAEDAVVLGTNYVVVADTNVPPYAFETNYITPVATDTAPASMSIAIYDVGNLTSNVLYDLYVRVHVNAGGYNDDSIFINSAGFGTNSLTFSTQNGIAGRTGLDEKSTTAAGFHWIKMNGTGDLGWLGAFNAGAGTNLTYAIAAREDGLDVDALAFVTAGLPVTDEMLDPANANVPLWNLGAIPDAPTTDVTPLLEAYFLDGAETVDTNSIAMTLNGTPVSGFTFSYSNSTTTISYMPASPLVVDTTYTAMVVVATSPSAVLFTNLWTFEVQSNPLYYFDATASNTRMAVAVDGPVGDGAIFTYATSDAVDGLWRFRTGFGVDPSVTIEPPSVVNSSSCTVWESGGNSGRDNAARLKTSVTNLPTANYDVYVYFWTDQFNSAWPIRAGLEDTAGTNTLTRFNVEDATQVAADSSNRKLLRGYLGRVENVNSIDVYVEDLPSTADTNGVLRSWYDGIGYQLATGTTKTPEITSLTIAGNTATLVWTSDVYGTYSIMHKTNATDAVWTAVKTNITGSDPTTTDSVTISGASQEFFSIEGF